MKVESKACVGERGESAEEVDAGRCTEGLVYIRR